MTDLVDLVSNDDFDDRLGNISFEFTIPPGESLKSLPIGNIVHWMKMKYLSQDIGPIREARAYLK